MTLPQTQILPIFTSSLQKMRLTARKSVLIVNLSLKTLLFWEFWVEF
ncbi:hypothetical protein [Campylobacter troglodytis]